MQHPGEPSIRQPRVLGRSWDDHAMIMGYGIIHYRQIDRVKKKTKKNHEQRGRFRDDFGDITPIEFGDITPIENAFLNGPIENVFLNGGEPPIWR